jgi:hypothetical protein
VQEQSKKDDNELFYYNKDEQVYKVFDPESKQWKTQQERPTDAQIEVLKNKQLERELRTLPTGEKEETKEKLLSEEELKRKEQKRLKRKRAL